MGVPVLKGMTWNHARGLDPLVAASARWAEQGGAAITWEARSLQDFEQYPLDDLARRFDLIVIDHPHVGQIVQQNCLAPFEDAAALAGIEAGSVGRSFESYRFAGRQWALPIDAAAQVLAYVPDRIAAPPATWDDVLALGRAGQLACPLRPPHALMTLFTLCGQFGGSPDVTGARLFDPEIAAEAYARLLTLAALVGDDARTQDPIAVFEAMAASDSPIATAPFLYGYANYARDGFRAHRIAFADLVPLGPAGVAGSALGGTGIAVSALGAHIDAARRFAAWVASAEVQRGLYASAGGQPGHDAAWRDATVNAATHDFYAATRATLEAAWLRPRHDGYMAFQQQASALLDAAIATRAPASPLIAALNELSNSFAFDTLRK
ncbi:ABC transporter substrate-binding protein [Sphingomonas hengshuiensis]|uniref:ABC transporter substrate-binding protein n=2 Tax=Sphingomonas hengshuiensis TaxID=1609977 RepID=A0A7U5HVG5_9SPHN|nr:ABC transporter substrate-binding protein [Sphingomonas hengshuiensis]